MFKYHFCYRIDERAQMGQNNETGEYCGIYAQITPEFEKEVPEDVQEEMHLLYGQALAEDIGFDPEYIHPITKQEYDENAE